MIPFPISAGQDFPGKNIIKIARKNGENGYNSKNTFKIGKYELNFVKKSSFIPDRPNLGKISYLGNSLK